MIPKLRIILLTMILNCVISGAVFLILATSVKCQANVNPTINITVSAGDDIFLEWKNPNPAVILWDKDGLTVEATGAARENRVFVVKEKGLLILNSEWEDGGYYNGLVVTNDAIPRRLEQVFYVDVAPTADVDVNAGGGFSCGFPRGRGKVVGGSEAGHGQSPWTVLLYDKINQGVVCGGVLLNRRWVLTAAHCFAQSRFDESNKDELEVRFGEHDVYQIEGTEVTLQIAQIITHPDYDIDTYDSDLTLLKLRQPVTYSDYIIPRLVSIVLFSHIYDPLLTSSSTTRTPSTDVVGLRKVDHRISEEAYTDQVVRNCQICLPSQLRAQGLVRDGKSGFVTGWGRTENALTSNVLRKVRLTIVNYEQCGEMHTETLTSNMLCAAAHPYSSDKVKDACQGDSGGPFAVRDNERWYLIGLVSWGIGCGNVNYPGVYVRVHRFRQWIEDLIQDDAETCEDSQFERGEQLTEANLEIIQLEEDLKLKEEQLQKALTETCQVQTEAIPSTTVTPTTTAEPTTTPPAPTLPPERVRCRGGVCWHVGGFGVRAQCENDYCVCDSPDYDRHSCLPSVDRCVIHTHPYPTAARATFAGVTQDTYRCVTKEPGRKSIHVLSVYEGNSNTRPPTAGAMNVILETESPSSKPVVLFLVSYEPVRWVIEVGTHVYVDEIVMVSYYIAESSVEWASGSPPDDEVQITGSRDIPRGYGKDSGGGNTVGLLKHVRDNYGPVNSFTGTYRADTWTLDINAGSWHHTPSSGSSTKNSVSTSRTSWTAYAFNYDNNYNACDGQQYVRSTEYDPGKFVGVMLCSPTRYKIFLSDDLEGTFRNVADTSGHGQDHCELVGADEVTSITIDSDFWLSPSATGFYRSRWGDPFEIGNIGGGIGADWTGKFYVQWYECGVSIP